MENLESLLNELSNSSNVSSETYSSADPVNIINNIESVILSNVTEVTTEKEYSQNLLFKSEHPKCLLYFFSENVRRSDKNIIQAKIAGLKFIAEYLKITLKYIDVYCPIIVTTLMDTFKKEDTGEMRACLLLPLKCIFRKCQKTNLSTNNTQRSLSSSSSFSKPINSDLLSAETINLESIYTCLLADLQLNKKSTSKTVKVEIIKLLGLLVGAYPYEQATKIKIENIVNYNTWLLQQNFSANAKNVDMSIVAAIFSCLDRCCYYYEDLVIVNEQNIKIIVFYEYLIKAISSADQDDVMRYAMANKALRFLKNHVNLFQNVIILNTEISFDILYKIYNNEKKILDKYSEDALLNFLMSLSSYIVVQYETTSSVDMKLLQVFQNLSRKFIKMFDDTKAHYKSIIVAISALSVMAGGLRILERITNNPTTDINVNDNVGDRNTSSMSSMNNNKIDSRNTSSNIIYKPLVSPYLNNLINTAKLHLDDTITNIDNNATAYIYRIKRVYILLAISSFLYSVQEIQMLSIRQIQPVTTSTSTSSAVTVNNNSSSNDITNESTNPKCIREIVSDDVLNWLRFLICDIIIDYPLLAIKYQNMVHKSIHLASIHFYINSSSNLSTYSHRLQQQQSLSTHSVETITQPLLNQFYNMFLPILFLQTISRTSVVAGSNTTSGPSQPISNDEFSNTRNLTDDTHQGTAALGYNIIQSSDGSDDIQNSTMNNILPSLKINKPALYHYLPFLKIF